MLVIRGLKKRYSSYPVLKGLDMTLNKGDVYGLIGRNGCGKTTTINIICNIIPKDEGEIILNGGQGLRLGYLPETPALYGYMSAREYLDFIAACCEYDGDVKMRTAKILDVVGLADVGKRRIKGFSRGMNQRLGIGAAIYREPDLLILDEPTSALDPEGRADVMTIISKLAETGVTILLCTHILTDIERVANRVGVLANGVMAVEGGVGEIAEKFSSETAFNVTPVGFDEEQVRLLRTAPFVRDSVVSKDKQSVTIYGEKNAKFSDLSDDILRYALDNKIQILNITPVQPNLEQIYMQLAGGSAVNRMEGF